MKENSIEEDEEILNNIKAFMQESINKGWHKFIYNDLGYEEKCADVINAIEHILQDYKRVLKENKELKETYKSEKKMKNEYVKLYQDLLLQENFIPIQKIKDNLIKYQEEYELLLEHQSGKESNRTKYLRGRIHMCQELLESEE